MTDKKEVIKNSIYKASLLIPFCLALAVCGGFSSFSGLTVACIGLLLLTVTPETSLFPTLTVFLILTWVFSLCGTSGIMICCAAGSAVSLLLYHIKPLNSFISKNKFTGAMSLITALFITISVTNIYFGIGASGNTAIEMLKSYRSLGFHPNWRGILYGTIVMVVMITFPRKFKKATRIVSPAFFALIITYILNLILVSEDSVKTFAEVGLKGFKPVQSDIKLVFSIEVILILIISSIAAALIICSQYIKNETGKCESVTGAVSTAVSGSFGLPFLSKGISGKKEIPANIIITVIAGFLTLLTGIFARLPQASLAVILIVAGWQNLDKPAIKDTFKKPLGIIGFLIAVAVSAIYSPAAGVIIAFLFSII